MPGPPHDFVALRAELGLPTVEQTSAFPADVEAEARQIAAAEPHAPHDLSDVDFVTIDPPGSMDLDQAVHLERRGAGGFRVRYAIADLGTALTLGGAVDAEARRRGETIYLPDGRVPLHPPVLSEGALSLLPDQLRRAVVWTVDVDADGRPGDVDVRRALVRSVARLDYDGVQASADAGEPHPSIEALADLGRIRLAYRVTAGALDPGIPEQEAVPASGAGDGAWTLEWRRRTLADSWNAEVSLLTGMAAAKIMLDAKIGLLRTLPLPDPQEAARFVERAAALGVAVGDHDTAATILARLDPTVAPQVALMTDSTALLRGAGFEAFDGEPPAMAGHAGVGGPYAQVTAPLRRLADRFCTEVCLAIAAGEPVAPDIRATLPSLPDVITASGHRAAQADRAAIDLVETWLLVDRVGETFSALVVHSDQHEATVLLDDPSVLAPCEGHGLKEGQRIEATLDEVDVAKRRVRFRS